MSEFFWFLERVLSYVWKIRGRKKGVHDRGISILEKYDLEASAASRGRGALICQTGQGLVLIREYYGSTRKLEYQAKLLEKISGQKEIHVDTLKRNKEENYITVDKENIPYLVKNWYDGKECDTQSRKDIMRSVKALASLHKTMQMPVWEHYVRESLLSEYERHNRELRKSLYFKNIRKMNLNAVIWNMQTVIFAVQKRLLSVSVNLLMTDCVP